MKNYNKILEAINKGIKFALDDFDDQEEIQGQTNSKVNNSSNIKEYLEWQQLIDNFSFYKYEFNGITSNDILRLGELSKITGLKYKISLEKLYNFIRNCINKRESLYHADLNWIDTSSITDMTSLFEYSNFNGDISEWDVGCVITMKRMFFHSQFNGDISQWDVSNVENMQNMFTESIFNGNISNWNVSKVRNMKCMFNYSEFNGDISKWNISSVWNMESMFFNASKFTKDLSNWDVTGIRAKSSMFSGCPIPEENKAIGYNTWL